jgi:hypothetical protein
LLRRKGKGKIKKVKLLDIKTELYRRGMPMTKLLEKVFSEISKLPKQEQDALAAWILEELASEQRWEKAFTASADQLAKMANRDQRVGSTFLS